ncbi:nuclear transport factor 2 family protein [Sneathiella sp. P13V-1]|uniref:nuclear transport factor 2 family protein n=1 Tax=Sneathiella sp. P13V-1 TaxID=2697366 RepID=UPI00187B5CDF|nr:nuclear transport factor 2 family protein [Sneathiella sp. P13V-1]MBE7638229.1 nuclear transport factor 2 family protein [Sneathiella sp. P13V-1]
MNIEQFMAAYKRVWEGQDSEGFAALFTENGEYWNTPFQVQNTPELRATYWDRIKLQEDISLRYEVLADNEKGGVAHWNVTYQVASEELFEIWAKSTGTGLPDRKAGDPLPRMELDGTLQASFTDDGLASCVRIWWHSIPRFPEA